MCLKVLRWLALTLVEDAEETERDGYGDSPEEVEITCLFLRSAQRVPLALWVP